jgi:SAM-dependent methyltransferase
VNKRLPAEARTALKHVGGPTTLHGDPALGAALERVFAVGEGDEAAVRAHVHAFHSYPARLHPAIARRAIEAFGRPGAVLLDPFCGSGTVVVEGRLLGARARGTDVNPLALRLARIKARGLPESERKMLVDACRRVEEHAKIRRTARARVTRKYGPEDVDLFEPHVLLELDSIRDGIDRIENRLLREDVELVFSAILTKVSRQRGDSGTYLQQRRIAPGWPAKLLVSKAEELARALAEFERLLPSPAPEVDVHADDARTLGTIGAATVDLVLTSPPYAATYDYLAHHDVRLRWLRLKPERFDELELGARRKYARLAPARARARWEEELGKTLSAIGRVLRPDGIGVIVIADSAVRHVALRADEIVEALAPKADLAVAAIASQARPHFHGPTREAFAAAPRREHLVALKRS